MYNSAAQLPALTILIFCFVLFLAALTIILPKSFGHMGVNSKYIIFLPHFFSPQDIRLALPLIRIDSSKGNRLLCQITHTSRH